MIKQLTKAAVNKSIAGKPYRLMATDEYGNTRAIAHGDYADMEAIKAVTRKEANPVIEENRPS